MSAADAALAVDGLRVELRSAASRSSRTSRWPSRPARSSASSASRAAARRRRRSRCSATRARACASPRGRVDVAGEQVVGRDERAARALRGRLVSYVPQDPGDRAQPGAAHRARDRRTCSTSTPARPRRSARSSRRSAGVHLPATRRVRAPLPAPALGRPAAAGDDRDRARLRAAARRARRADHRPRRRDAGARARGDRPAAPRAGARDGLRLARSRRRRAGRRPDRGHVRGPDRRGGAGRQPCSPSRGIPTRAASSPRSPITRRRAGCAGMPGVAVGVGERPPGCAFAPRCPQRVDRCDGRAAAARADRRRPRACAASSGAGRRRSRSRERRSARPHGVARSAPLLAVEGLRAGTARGLARRGRRRRRLLRRSARGECLALVGESGSGKTTIARCVAGLHAPAAGRILARRRAAGRAGERRARGEARRRIQIVFQNPYDSLNPRHRVATRSPGRRASCAASRAATRRRRSRELLERVRLPARIAAPLPRRALGRRAPARRDRARAGRAAATSSSATRSRPRSTSRSRPRCSSCSPSCAPSSASSLLFISHDLGVVASVADRVLVLDGGCRLRGGRRSSGCSRTRRTDYTRRLVEAAPQPAGGPAMTLAIRVRLEDVRGGGRLEVDRVADPQRLRRALRCVPRRGAACWTRRPRSPTEPHAAARGLRRAETRCARPADPRPRPSRSTARIVRGAVQRRAGARDASVLVHEDREPGRAPS